MFSKLFSQITIFQVNNHMFEMCTSHQMANNPKPLEVENHIVSNSEDIDFTGMPELEDDIKINKTLQLFYFIFCIYEQTFLAKYCFHSQH